MSDATPKTSRPAWLDRMIELVFAVSFATLAMEIATLFGVHDWPGTIAAGAVGAGLGYFVARSVGASLIKRLRRGR